MELERNPLRKRNERVEYLWSLVPYGEDIKLKGLSAEELIQIGKENGYWDMVRDQDYWREMEVLNHLQTVVAILRSRQLAVPRQPTFYNDLFELIAMMAGDKEGEKTAAFFADLEDAGFITIKNRRVIVNL